MSGVDVKEHRAVGDQTDTMDLGRSEICKQGEVFCQESLAQQGASGGCEGLGMCDQT